MGEVVMVEEVSGTNSIVKSSGPIGPFPWRPRLGDLAIILGLFALSRALLVAAGVAAWTNQVPRSEWRGRDHSGIRYAVVPDNPFLDMWTRWDSWQYEEIARQGYWFDINHKPRPYGTVACFPLYPMVLRVVGMLMGGRYILAGLAISNLSALVGFALLFQWMGWWADRRAAWLAVSAAIFHPAGLFWSALYPQSLFFAISTASLASMLDGRVAIACLLGAAATAARLEGVALLPALLAIYLNQRRWRLGRDALWLLITPLGLLVYMAYLHGRWGDPVLFLKIHSYFDRRLTNPVSTLAQLWTDPRGFQDPKILGTYATGMAMLLARPSKQNWPIVLYGWTLFLIPLSTGVYISIYRVHLVNLPVYLAIGSGLRGRLRILGWGLVAASGLLEIVTMFFWGIGFYLP